MDVPRNPVAKTKIPPSGGDASSKEGSALCGAEREDGGVECAEQCRRATKSDAVGKDADSAHSQQQGAHKASTPLLMANIAKHATPATMSAYGFAGNI